VFASPARPGGPDVSSPAGGAAARRTNSETGRRSQPDQIVGAFPFTPALTRLLRKGGNGIRLSEHLEGADGTAVFRAVCAMDLEGIVAKRRDRPYWSGRSRDWVKVRNPNAPASTRIMEWE